MSRSRNVLVLMLVGASVAAGAIRQPPAPPAFPDDEMAAGQLENMVEPHNGDVIPPPPTLPARRRDQRAPARRIRQPAVHEADVPLPEEREDRGAQQESDNDSLKSQEQQELAALLQRQRERRRSQGAGERPAPRARPKPFSAADFKKFHQDPHFHPPSPPDVDPERFLPQEETIPQPPKDDLLIADNDMAADLEEMPLPESSVFVLQQQQQFGENEVLLDANDANVDAVPEVPAVPEDAAGAGRSGGAFPMVAASGGAFALCSVGLCACRRSRRRRLAKSGILPLVQPQPANGASPSSTGSSTLMGRFSGRKIAAA